MTHFVFDSGKTFVAVTIRRKFPRSVRVLLRTSRRRRRESWLIL